MPGVTVDRQCGSSQQSVHFAAAGVVAGHYDIVVAGGVESMSRIPMGSSLANGGHPYPEAFRARYTQTPNQGIGAEMIAQQWGFDRTALDQFSLDSHEKAAAAQDRGAFDDQIVAIKDQDGNPVTADEGIRRGTTLEKMGQLKPAFTEDGVIHAGNSSQICDGSAALLFMSAERAKELGLKPLARVHTAVLAGADPVIMLSAPIPATQKALQRSGLSVDDIGVFEVNEAFAPVPMAWLKDIGGHEQRLNPNGGAIALGHPLGGSGARIMTTMLYHMRDNGIQFGLQTMCEGGGQATRPSSSCCSATGNASGAPAVLCRGDGPANVPAIITTGPRPAMPSTHRSPSAVTPCNSARCVSITAAMSGCVAKRPTIRSAPNLARTRQVRDKTTGAQRRAQRRG